MTESIEFPWMRLQVVTALDSLSDPSRQERWGCGEKGVPGYFDDLTLNVDVLYDDCMVLPEPQDSVPEILHQEEVPFLVELARALGPLIDELGDLPDAVYTSDPRWPSVIEAAARALAVMKQNDGEPPA